MLKTIKILIGLLCFHICGNAQISSKDSLKIDSLKNVFIDKSYEDSCRLDAFKELTNLFLNSDSNVSFSHDSLFNDLSEPLNKKEFIADALIIKARALDVKKKYDESIIIFEDAISIYKELDLEKKFALNKLRLGKVFKNKELYLKALNCFETSLIVFEKYDDSLNVAASCFEIGSIFSSLNNSKNAIKFYQKSKSIHEKFNNERSLISCLNNLGTVYYSIGYNNKALKCFKQSEKLREDLGLGKGAGFFNIASILLKMKELDKALVYFKECEQINIEAGQDKKQAQIYVFDGLCNTYLMLEDYEIAEKYILKALNLAENLNYSYGKMFAYFSSAKLYKKLSNYRKSTNHANISLDIALMIGNQDYIKNTSRFLYEIYKKKNNSFSALKMHEIYVHAKDSIAKMDAKQDIYKNDLEKEYQFNKQRDSLENVKLIVVQKAQNKVNIQKLKNVKQRNNGLILVCAIILISLLFIFLQLKKVRNKKEIIELKQNEINDSINYANRLQKGILPPESFIKNCLPKSFILFKPKDVVSGDFYWVEKVGSNIYFAVADCTGHGVPGAMVSIVCSNALTKSLFEDNIASPAKILDNTRAIVENKFMRSADDIKDGMDISLAALDTKNNSLVWSGANNPLWIVRNGGNEIEEIKPTKQAIGKILDPKPFMEHKIQLNKGDSLYLFSDGFQDQFGGEKGKKYMKGKMKKFLISISDKSMEEQNQLLSKEFNSWKGDLEQIDDVCVMGVRI